MRQVGPFSWLHLLSIVTLVSPTAVVSLARAGKIAAHWQTMAYFNWSGLVWLACSRWFPAGFCTRCCLAPDRPNDFDAVIIFPMPYGGRL